MKIHTTNYKNTFIEIADDCPVEMAEVPQMKGDKKSIAVMQFEMLIKNPYTFTSDDVLFQIYAERNDFTAQELPLEREKFFSKGQACFRASPLAKRYGYGVHSDKEGRLAIYGAESVEYAELVKDPNVAKVKAMRSKRV